MNPIGVMQGRLSPPVNGRVQAFPVDTWQSEFERARQAGLSCIEWVYEAETEGANPLASASGILTIQALAQCHRVSVRSICADYYMERLLLRPNGSPNSETVRHLIWLIGQASQLGCRYIVLPFVDASRLAGPQHLRGLAHVLAEVLPAAGAKQVELHLETDLAPAVLAAFLAAHANPRLKANLDTGNSASLGHEPRHELEQLGRWVGSVHIKDRVRGGGTVPLGTGDTDLETYVALLLDAGYDGSFILQVARSSPGDELAWCRQNRQRVTALMQARRHAVADRAHAAS